MRILIISHEYPPIGGGGANACMYLAREYAKQGHNVDILTVWFEGEKEEIVNNDYKGCIRIYRLKSKRSRKDSCSFKEMLDFILKALPISKKLVNERIYQNNPYDICQIFFGIPSGVIGWYLKKIYKLPYVIRFGGGDIPGFQERFKSVYKLIGPFVKVIWKRADALVANSNGLRDFAFSFCDKYPIEVVYNGVDTEKFCPAIGKNEFSEDMITLLFVSRLIERKGLQFLIPHLREIEENIGRKIRLLIVGDGPYKDTLVRLAEDRGVSNLVEFAGQRDKAELLPYYQRGDIFVFPSMKEGMPNVVLEAMACGLPIVMSPCQGSEELIDGNGLITDANLELFYESVIRVLSYPYNTTQKMGETSRKRAEDLFSWNKVGNSYLKIYESLSDNNIK